MNPHRKFSRRDLLATAGAAILAARAAGSDAREPLMAGIQVGAISFVDEGVDAVLDNFQKMAGVNTLFLATFTYGRGIAGRQVPGQPLPDHGARDYDTNFRGGFYTTSHAQFYRHTSIRPERAAELPGVDILEKVLPATKARGMKVICWFEDVFRSDVPGFEQAAEVDLHGRRASRACLRNPNTRNFWLGLAEDYLRSYPVDGLMWGSERQGPLNNAIGASHGGGGDPGRVGCFCEHCLAAAKTEGISADRARAGFLELEKLVNTLRKDGRPADGAFASFWRVLVNYPEVLAWERLWNEGLRETYRDLYRLAHSAAKDKVIGWHIWHNNTFSPFYRAEQDYSEFRKYSDFLKVVMYNNCGGPRMAQYVRNVTRTIFADLSPEESLNLNYRLQQFHERPLAEISTAGLSADYVARETRRALAGVEGGSTKIWPGIDIDIPTAANEKKTQPEDVHQAVRAALAAGAHGVILSRKYSEMKLENLRAAGKALRNVGGD